MPTPAEVGGSPTLELCTGAGKTHTRPVSPADPRRLGENCRSLHFNGRDVEGQKGDQSPLATRPA